MAQFVVANNVNTQLAAALPSSGAGSTTVVLASSANLPTLNTATGQMMPLTLNDAATGAIYETVYVTAISGATLTVLRGQEGTSALNWSVGDFAFCAPTAGTTGLTTMRTQYQASAAFSSSQTLTAAIAGESIGFTGTSAATFSMPGQSTVPALTPTAVYNDGTAALTLTANGSDKFVVATGQVTSIVMQPGDDLTFYASTTAGLWTAASGSALRQYEPLVVGTATQPAHAVQLGQVGHGQCRFIFSSATATKLIPYNGQNLIINGVPQQIPSAGVSLANTSLAASTFYYVYAEMLAGVMTLLGSTTGHVTGANGVEVMIGDATKTLVGSVLTNSSSQFSTSNNFYGVISWFNRQSISLQPVTAVNASFSSATPDEINTGNRITFISWLGESVLCTVCGYISNTASQAACVVGIGFNSTSVITGQLAQGNVPFAGAAISASTTITPFIGTENQAQYMTPLGEVSAGSGSFNIVNTVTIRG